MVDEDELDMIPAERLQYLAVQTRIQADTATGSKTRYKKRLIVRHFFNDLYDCLFLYHSFVDLLLITLFINLFIFIVIIWRKRPFSLRGQLNLKFANKILKNISNKKREPRMPRTTNLQKRVNIISPPYSYDRGLPSS